VNVVIAVLGLGKNLKTRTICDSENRPAFPGLVLDEQENQCRTGRKKNCVVLDGLNRWMDSNPSAEALGKFSSGRGSMNSMRPFFLFGRRLRQGFGVTDVT